MVHERKLFKEIKAEERTGYCLCGCGEKTPIACVTRNERGDKKGYPVRYISGHNAKDPEWRKNIPIWTSKTNWSGGKILSSRGYILRHKRTFTPEEYEILRPMFLSWNKRGTYILEHRALMAIKQKHILAPNEIVRHLDGNKQNNSLENLALGSHEDNMLDHDTARKEVIKLKEEIIQLKKELEYWRLHGGKDAKVLWKGKI